MLSRAWWGLVRLGFRLLYNEMAWSYDAVAWAVSLGQWRAWQSAALPYVHGRRVLELAHGPGHMLIALHEAGHKVTGLDLSPYMGRQARRRLRRHGIDRPLVGGSALALPFAAGSFDTVLATFPTDFILAPATLGAVARVLVDDGRLLIVPEGRLAGDGPLQRVILWLYTITGQLPAGDDPEVETAVRRFLDPIIAAGFTPVVEHVHLLKGAATVVIAAKRPWDGS